MSKNSKQTEKTEKNFTEIITSGNLTELRLFIGQSEKKVKNSETEFVSIPENGTFATIGVMVYPINAKKEIGTGFLLTDNHAVDKTKYIYSLGLTLENGGFVSESALTAQNLLSELTVIKNGPNKDRFTLKSERLSDFSSLAGSQNGKLSELQGKSFTTTKNKNGRVWKNTVFELDANGVSKYRQNCTFNANTPDNLEKALDKTETKTLYTFKLD